MFAQSLMFVSAESLSTMEVGLTPSEKFVNTLCKCSFLTLWTHPNPKGRNNKELCDCLIVCGPHIVIISVKECEYKDTGNEIGWERWRKAAIDKSVSQIFGAERWLRAADHVVRHDGRTISLPDKTERKYHRISVSLGGSGKVPIKWGDLGGGFVHVCDEKSVEILLGALDTITDLVSFLDASESLVSSGVALYFDGAGLEDLIALYLSGDGGFDILAEVDGAQGMLVIGESIWENYSESEAYRAMRSDFEESYRWDAMIESLANDLLVDGMFDMHSEEVTKDEMALVTMAIQPRAHRAVLAEQFMELVQNSKLKLKAKAVKGFAETAFVFLIGKSSETEFRVKELVLRCVVIRGRIPGVKTVVGIAADRPGTSEVGYSTNLVYFCAEEWTHGDDAKVAGIQSELGYFRNLDLSSS